MKNIFFALLLLPVLALSQDETAGTDRTLAPYFQIISPGFHTDPLPLKANRAEVRIAGVIADVQVTQVYVNSGTMPLEAVYVFPGSSNAAVYGMQMQIGRRLITAKIAEKQQARQQYEQAKEEGKRASLLEQFRPNVFQMNVANIMPGDTIEVRLRYTELLVPREGEYQFVFPTVVGPRYHSGEAETTTASNAYVASPFLPFGQTPSVVFGLQIALNGGMPIQAVSSSSHAIQVKSAGLNQADIRLDPSESNGGNRDFILNYSLKSKKIESGLLLYDDGPEQYFLYLAQPPQRVEKDEMPPREYVFIVDVSGSMNGFPLQVSKTLLRNLVSGLGPQDRFNVLLFAGGSDLLGEQSLAGTPENLDRAIRLIDTYQGGGGTELLPALRRALALPRNTEGLSRSFVVVTDGYVDVEKEAFDLVRGKLDEANLFAFGIGSSVNRFLIEGLARAGQSEAAIITRPDEAAKAADRFRQYLSTPVLTQIKARFEGFQVYDVEPLSIPDILAERPVVIFGKYRGEAQGKIGIQGRAGTKKYNTFFQLGNTRPETGNVALKYLWARERIKKLDDYNAVSVDSAAVAEVTRLGLQYSLLTAYTSFVAIDEEIAHDGTVKPRTVKQPSTLPAGVSELAVGFDLSLSGITRMGQLLHTQTNTEHDNAVFPMGLLLLAVCLLLGLAGLGWWRMRRA
ncbi:MAG: VWA domain-containing protein [Saprospiraceae bacterium]|nr:VWA domain-containing protein [Saprospiraceae bacterium]